MNWNVIWLSLSLCFSSVLGNIENYTIDSLDAALQDIALQTLVRHRHHTGALYKAMLPANLSGMKVSIVRLRSRRLWNIGADFSSFHIPSRTLTVPHVKRLAIVYQDFGNWSSNYYSVPGYSMITPVTGFMVFDASNVRARRITKLSLNTTGKPIMIRFSNSTFSDGMISRATRCATFSSDGALQLSEMSLPNVCYSQDQGHFTIVVPLKKKKRTGLWYLWVIGFVLGFGVLVLVGFVGVVSLKLLKTKKIQVMEKQADEDLVLDTIWVGGSKMPSATVTRTQPVIEEGGFA
ncbi:hypothetical protein Dsin_007827 [Dipteronia sinensis]|uniref:Uncharacterized protein n=1 Tax=Dipteronia sinensis TaxID=43782 RepID=A0AAE0EIT0_9ROSI|nr:hypothetical protein Dsin_007827 [Dipteronia sinensis]